MKYFLIITFLLILLLVLSYSVYSTSQSLKYVISTEEIIGTKNKPNDKIPIEIKQEEVKEKQEQNNYPFIQPTYSDNLLNLSNFNYEGKCKEIFKYKSNNKMGFGIWFIIL